jgi:hypothetical protein
MFTFAVALGTGTVLPAHTGWIGSASLLTPQAALLHAPNASLRVARLRCLQMPKKRPYTLSVRPLQVNGECNSTFPELHQQVPHDSF